MLAYLEDCQHRQGDEEVHAQRDGQARKQRLEGQQLLP
jgi:hypothetical protein